MRHRGQNDTSGTDSTTSGANSALVSLAQLRAITPQAAGKHRAPVAMPQIPEQKLPTHDTVVEALAPAAPEQTVAPEKTDQNAAKAAAQTAAQTAARIEAARVTRIQHASDASAVGIPQHAQWRASHLPRAFAGTLLTLAVLGTTGLGIRYAQTRTSDEFISLAIGLGVVVALWALLIASTPQVVSLEGSVLTVANNGGCESFDLADGLQAVDVVGDPRTSHWAVLLHRPNSTTVVLRRHDVDAFEVDPIVRHYRSVANRRFTDRETRFSR
jgi:hypothetical protein